ncbi:MAG: Uma2 family endonuclease [Treponema sp.]|nr:Uma2 family endonuclease [Treponema sp.]
MHSAVRVDEEFPEKHRYTYADYLGWEGQERYELIDGEAFMMSSPSVAHQALLMGLSSAFDVWLQGKSCRVFAAPLDVRLFPKEDKSDRTVVQPDLLVVCDKSKLDKGSVNGPPDLIIEIVSPSNTYSELFRKFNYYLKAKVREYWVVDPELKSVSVHIYEDGRYIITAYNDNDRIPVTVLDGLEISLESLWARLPL